MSSSIAVSSAVTDFRGECRGDSEVSLEPVGEFALDRISNLHWISLSDLFGSRMDSSMTDRFLEPLSLRS